MQSDSPSPTGQYDFIMGAGQQPKKKLFSGGSRTTKIVLLVSAVTVIIIILSVLAASLFGRSGVRTDRLLALGQKQTEIIRTATLASPKVRDNDTLGFILAAKLAVTSQLNQVKEFSAENGKKLNEKNLAAGKDASTDDNLAEAEQSSRYDETARQIIAAGLADYSQTLKSDAQTASNAKEKELLNSLHIQIAPLLK